MPDKPGAQFQDPENIAGRAAAPAARPATAAGTTAMRAS
jgi:hypothetical protein